MRQRSEEPLDTRQVRHSPNIFGILMIKHKIEDRLYVALDS